MRSTEGGAVGAGENHRVRRVRARRRRTSASAPPVHRPRASTSSGGRATRTSAARSARREAHGDQQPEEQGARAHEVGVPAAADHPDAEADPEPVDGNGEDGGSEQEPDGLRVPPVAALDDRPAGRAGHGEHRPRRRLRPGRCGADVTPAALGGIRKKVPGTLGQRRQISSGVTRTRRPCRAGAAKGSGRSRAWSNRSADVRARPTPGPASRVRSAPGGANYDQSAFP